MLDDSGDCPSRWLYKQFAGHHPGPAPGQNHCPGPMSHLSPLHSTVSIGLVNTFFPARAISTSVNYGFDIFSIPAMSSEPKRLFSSAKRTLTDDREGQEKSTPLGQ